MISLSTAVHYSKKYEIQHLQPIDYTLSDYDVYCGRGKHCFDHRGNQNFRQIILDNLSRYSKANSKYAKSSIIDEIVDHVRGTCRQHSGLGFVKKDAKTGRFYEVGNYLAREKTSQAFRDALQEKLVLKKEGGSVKKKKRIAKKSTREQVSIRSINEEVYVTSDDQSELSSHNNTCPMTKTSNASFGKTIESFRSMCERTTATRDTFIISSPLDIAATKIMVETIESWEDIDEFDEAALDMFLNNLSETSKQSHGMSSLDEFAKLFEDDMIQFRSDFFSSHETSKSPSHHFETQPTKTSSSSSSSSPFLTSTSMEHSPLSIPTIPRDEDATTFDLLLQLTESYPHLHQCPLLKGRAM